MTIGVGHEMPTLKVEVVSVKTSRLVFVVGVDLKFAVVLGKKLLQHLHSIGVRHTVSTRFAIRCSMIGISLKAALHVIYAFI